MRRQVSYMEMCQYHGEPNHVCRSVKKSYAGQKQTFTTRYFAFTDKSGAFEPFCSIISFFSSTMVFSAASHDWTRGSSPFSSQSRHILWFGFVHSNPEDNGMGTVFHVVNCVVNITITVKVRLFTISSLFNFFKLSEVAEQQKSALNEGRPEDRWSLYLILCLSERNVTHGAKKTDC